MPLTPDRANQHMVDCLIAEGSLWSQPLIDAFRATPRHRFLDSILQFDRKQESWRPVATSESGKEALRLIYSDRALITHVSPPGREGPGTPISSSSQPSLMAQMLEELKLAPGMRVLEVGSGTGYNAALIAHVVGPRLVTSMDVDRRVLFEAWDHLRGFPERGVELKHADGRHGHAEAAPYDRIMVTAATPDLEPAWLDQLAEGGLLMAPLVFAPGLAFIVCGTASDGIFTGRLTRAAYFMLLRTEGESGENAERPWQTDGELVTLPAPWTRWFDRDRTRHGWFGFVQSLAFFGLLRGLGVHYQSQKRGQPIYGVQEADAICWFSPQKWEVSAESGKVLGLELWRAFLEAGGPRPTEFLLKACCASQASAGQGTGYYRQGARCLQHWERLASIERPALV